jgi:hypothetical protein
VNKGLADVENGNAISTEQLKAAFSKRKKGIILNESEMVSEIEEENQYDSQLKLFKTGKTYDLHGYLKPGFGPEHDCERTIGRRHHPYCFGKTLCCRQGH